MPCPIAICCQQTIHRRMAVSSGKLQCLQTRAVGDSILLEACLENKTRRLMLLEKVALLSRPCWRAVDLQSAHTSSPLAKNRCAESVALNGLTADIGSGQHDALLQVPAPE